MVPPEQGGGSLQLFPRRLSPPPVFESLGTRLIFTLDAIGGAAPAGPLDCSGMRKYRIPAFSFPQLQSYVLNRAAKVDKALAGYCLYYKYHTDLKILGLSNSTEDIGSLQQVFFVTAIFFLCLIIAIRVPAALYSVIVIPINSGQSLTTKQTSTSGDNSKTENNQAPMNEDSRGFTASTASTITDRLEKQTLYNIKESNYTHYFFAIFAIAPFLDIGIIILNICMLKKYEMTRLILGFSTTTILFSTIELILIPVLAHRKKNKFNHWNMLSRIMYGVGVFSVVLALQLLSFHGTFILLAFISAPLSTISFAFIYISALFSLLGVVGTVIKVVFKYKCHKKEIHKKKCHYVFQIITDMLSFLCVLSFDALFIILMRYQVQHNHFGISGFFGALLPTAVIALISFGGGKLTGMVQKNDKSLPSAGGGDSEVYFNQLATESTPTTETTTAQLHPPSPSQQSLPQKPTHDVAKDPTTFPALAEQAINSSSTTAAAAAAMHEPAKKASMTATGNKRQVPGSIRKLSLAKSEEQQGLLVE